MKQRRVVTGLRDGHEVIVEDAEIEGIHAGPVEATVVNKVERGATVPADGSNLPVVNSPADFKFPVEDAVMVSTFRVPGHTSLPGPPNHDEHDARPGYHATDSIDTDIVLEGEMEYEIEDGSAVTLRKGDWIIKNGTGHAWHNRTSEPAMVLSVNYGARRVTP